VDAFGYLSVLISIVLGIGIAQLLTGIGRAIEARDRVRGYWPTFVWAGFLLLVHVQTWWVMYGLRAYRGWTFGAFLAVLVQPSLLYLVSALVLPHDVGRDDGVDLRAHYYRQAPWLFGLAVLLLAQSIGRDLLLDGRLPTPANLAAHATFAALWTGGALTRREGYHRLVAVVTGALFAVYVAALFTRLR
jgi:hypothetical protein